MIGVRGPPDLEEESDGSRDERAMTREGEELHGGAERRPENTLRKDTG